MNQMPIRTCIRTFYEVTSSNSNPSPGLNSGSDLWSVNFTKTSFNAEKEELLNIRVYSSYRQVYVLFETITSGGLGDFLTKEVKGATKGQYGVCKVIHSQVEVSFSRLAPRALVPSMQHGVSYVFRVCAFRSRLCFLEGSRHLCLSRVELKYVSVLLVQRPLI